jgi:2-polyprenyl-3-methyl-5-hydroxy-6-metoxy-1,4-benzoquinol methylase
MNAEEETQERIKREQDFHNQRFGESDHVREPTSKYYAVMRPVKNRYKQMISQCCEGKRLLEYGCATGGTTFSWARNGASVFGIDISDEAVKIAKETAAKEGLPVEFAVMNAEALDFPAKSFDMIVGTGILHHLNLNRSYSELSRVLNQDGFALFIEPMGHNPLINFYRWLTPKMRTDDEHPFKTSDINLAKEYFEKVDVEYYNLLSLSSIVFRNWKSYPSILAFANRIDQILFTMLPFTKKWAWMVILKLSLPHEQETHNGSVKIR